RRPSSPASQGREPRHDVIDLALGQHAFVRRHRRLAPLLLHVRDLALQQRADSAFAIAHLNGEWIFIETRARDVLARLRGDLDQQEVVWNANGPAIIAEAVEDRRFRFSDHAAQPLLVAAAAYVGEIRASGAALAVHAVAVDALAFRAEEVGAASAR